MERRKKGSKEWGKKTAKEMERKLHNYPNPYYDTFAPQKITLK